MKSCPLTALSKGVNELKRFLGSRFSMPYAACSMQYAVCSMDFAMRSMQYAVCSMATKRMMSLVVYISRPVRVPPCNTRRQHPLTIWVPLPVYQVTRSTTPPSPLIRVPPCNAQDSAPLIRVIAIYQIIVGWETYKYTKYYYETVELPNPRPTQRKKN